MDHYKKDSLTLKGSVDISTGGMIRAGIFALLGQIAEFLGYVNLGSYATSNHAVVSIMRTTTVEAAPLKIKGNTINPSPVNNRMMRSIEDGASSGHGDEVQKHLKQQGVNKSLNNKINIIIKKQKCFYIIFILLLLINTSLLAQMDTTVYNLDIKQETVNLAGKDVMGMTINGSIPGPTLRFVEGEYAVIYVKNNMDVETSVHWHGLLLPNFFDGVPYLTTPPIEPGATQKYEFPLVQSGTYWYHSHTMLQEQIGRAHV